MFKRRYYAKHSTIINIILTVYYVVNFIYFSKKKIEDEAKAL